jgi:hypothetical protein
MKDSIFSTLQILFEFFLGFLNLSKNDSIQQGTADAHKIPLLIEMCDEYPIAFDIIWALSFNKDIQQQLRSSAPFISQLAHLEKGSDNEQMRKIMHGIRWNLEIHGEDHATSVINDKKSFDIMISYSHKEKILCKQLYEELTKAGYRVWIDFDQMHGNVMDAMAEAIERSHTIIICMSEQYRRSNYCRAEAHYAFQRQRKIVPVLLQQHYKPDGWLLFLIGQLLYIDFNKYEFGRAIEMLFKELKADGICEIQVSRMHPKVGTHTVVSSTAVVLPKTSPSSIIPENILEWTQSEVQQWLVEHNLIQMSHLLIDYDGRSLVYLNKYMKKCELQQILLLLQEDSVRRTNQSVSLIEICRFQSLMDRQTQSQQSSTDS